MKFRSNDRVRIAMVVWFLAWALAVNGGSQALGQNPTLRADSPPSQTYTGSARDYVRALVTRVRLEASNRFLEEELRRLRAVDSFGPFSRAQFTESESREAALKFLRVNFQQFLEGIRQQDLRPANDQTDKLTTDAERVRSRLYDRTARLFERAATTGTAGQLTTLLSHNNLSFLLTGFLAVTALAGIVIHHRRHELRRLLSGGKAQKLRLWNILKYGLGALAVLVLFVSTDQYLLGNRLYHALLLVGSAQTASPQQQFSADVEIQKRDLPALESAQKELEKEFADACQSCRTKATRTLGQSGQSAALLDDWETFLKSTRDLKVAVETQKELRAGIEKDLKDLERLNHDFDQVAAVTAGSFATQNWIRVGAGFALLVAVVTLGVLFFTGVVREQRISERTCPQCLALDSLKAVASSQGVSTAIQRNLEMLKCDSEIPTVDRSGHPTTVACGFESRAKYQRRPKLCFPTLGIPTAGKTVWLVQAYKEINNGELPTEVRLDRLKTPSSDSLDAMLQDLLDNRVNPIGTQVHRIPHPIVFSLVDRDFLGKSEVLLNLFDYSGEITEVGSVASNLNDPRRQRALQADGYLFMLDPTFPSEPQAKALANFREDVRLVRGIKNSQEIRVPVALCITKIDKLVDQPYASPDGGDAIAEFFRELREIDPTGKARNLNVIEARSQLASRLCDTIWPGFQVERLLRDAFGGRCMLFPTAAFGLDNLGAPDDQKRLVAFGVVEPLLWLLHMNGYPVLD